MENEGKFRGWNREPRGQRKAPGYHSQTVGLSPNQATGKTGWISELLRDTIYYVPSVSSFLEWSVYSN